MLVVETVTIIAILAISGFWNSDSVGSATVPSSDCIMVMGGKRATAAGDISTKDLIEYYHPAVDVECSRNHILPNWTVNLWQDQMPVFSSGCYLSKSTQIVVRESKWGHETKQSVTFGLQLGGLINIVPQQHISSISGSTSASVGLSRCLSCGGIGGSDKCYEFNTSTNNQWVQILSLPNGAHSAASVSLGHFYYVIGGFRTGKATSQLYRYDVENARWGVKKSMSFDRHHHSAAPLSDHEFITCGGANVSDCEIYNATSDTWRMGGNISTYRVYLHLINFNGKIYAVGGSPSLKKLTHPLATVETYNRKSNSWSVVNKSLNVARYGFVAFAIKLPKKPTNTSTTNNVTDIQRWYETSMTSKPKTTPVSVAIMTEGSTAKMPISTLLLIFICFGIVVIVIMIPVAVTIVVLVVLYYRRQRKKAADDDKYDKIVLPSSIEYNPNWPKPKKDATLTDNTDTKSAPYEPDTVTSHRINVSLPPDGEYTTTEKTK